LAAVRCSGRQEAWHWSHDRSFKASRRASEWPPRVPTFCQSGFVLRTKYQRGETKEKEEKRSRKREEKEERGRRREEKEHPEIAHRTNHVTIDKGDSAIVLVFENIIGASVTVQQGHWSCAPDHVELLNGWYTLGL
jgi:hypothetical protein